MDGEPTCRECGCTWNNACHDEERGACSWAEPDLCSHCEDSISMLRELVTGTGDRVEPTREDDGDPMVTAVMSTPVIEPDRSMLAAVLYAVVTGFAATTGAAGAPTVIDTVAGLDVPPGFVRDWLAIHDHREAHRQLLWRVGVIVLGVVAASGAVLGALK